LLFFRISGACVVDGSGVITITNAGKYFITATIHMNPSTNTSFRRMWIRDIDGATVIALVEQQATANVALNGNITVSAAVDSPAGNTFDIRFRHEEAGLYIEIYSFFIFHFLLKMSSSS
jgi:hypothetical protein